MKKDRGRRRYLEILKSVEPFYCIGASGLMIYSFVERSKVSHVQVLDFMVTMTLS